MTSETEQKNIADVLARLTVLSERLTIIENRLPADTALAPANGKKEENRANGESPDKASSDKDSPAVAKETASPDAEYWAAAVQVGLALSLGTGLTGWQTAMAALLPAVVQGVDNSSAGKPVLKSALVPAALGGLGFVAGRAIGGLRFPGAR